jgi:hypothetical protein
MSYLIRALRFGPPLAAPAAVMVWGLLAGLAQPAAAYNGKASMILHVASPAAPSCESVPASLGDVVTAWPSGSGGSAQCAVYVLVDVPDTLYEGIDHLKFSVWGRRGCVSPLWVTLESWESCAPLEIPDPGWPASGKEVALYWGNADGGCETRHTFVAGWFMVDPTCPGTLSLYGGWDKSIYLAGCGLRSYALDTKSQGWVSFGGAASASDNDGCNPWIAPCHYDDFPPPTYPTIPPQDPAVMLHVTAAGGAFPCFAAPTEATDIVTAAEAEADGSAHYYVYLLGSPRGGEYTWGLAGMQLGIRYDQGHGGIPPIKLDDWHYCSDLEFSGDLWPRSGSGNTLTWVAPENCQYAPIVTAGFFELTAYSAGAISIIPSPYTGEIKVANCGGAETALEQALPLTRAGWVALGRGLSTEGTGGCNPLLAPCAGPTPTLPTTWGKIKTLYR